MTQLRLAMFALSTVAAVSWTAVSALAFSQDSLSTGGAGSSTFADSDEQVNKAFGLENGAEPSGLSSVQSGPQQRKLDFFKHFQIDSITSPSNPLSRPGN